MSTEQPPESRTERKKAEMRRNIVEVAAQLLARHGIEGLSAEAVAKEADVALQTVYNRVGGKPALLKAVTELAIAENRRYMDVAYAQEGEPMARLERAANAYADFAFSHPHLFLLLNAPPDDEATQQLVALKDIQNGKAIQAYREGVERGELRSDLPPEEAITVLWAMINGVLTLALQPGAHRLPEDGREGILRVTTSILKQGLVRMATSNSL